MNQPLAFMSQIIEELNLASQNDEFTFNFVVQRSFDQTDTTFPRVVIRQVANRPRHTVTANLPSENETTTTLGYQLEIYTRDTIARDTNVYERTNVADILVDEIKDWFWANYSFKRNTWSPSNVVDDATTRSVLRVNGVIDLNGFTYSN